MTDSTKPHFHLPSIFDNQSGWGPASDLVPAQFNEIPYAPYSKGDKLGRVADWTNPEGQKQDNREQTRQGRTGGFNRFNKGKESMMCEWMLMKNRTTSSLRRFICFCLCLLSQRR
jgi:hypothetical protein